MSVVFFRNSSIAALSPIRSYDESYYFIIVLILISLPAVSTRANNMLTWYQIFYDVREPTSLTIH